MSAKRPLPRRVVDAIDRSKMLSIRAGAEHRFIGIWAVVVERRVFVRSWSLKARSWYRAFLEEPAVAIRAVRTRGERLRDAVSRAYLEKYSTPGSLKYAKDLGRKRSREATI